MKKVNMIERTEEKKVAERLDQLARKAGDEVETFNNHQRVVDKVKGLSGAVLNAKEISDKRKYSTELPNALDNGTAKSKALGSEIVDVLQGRLPRTKAAIPRVPNPRPSVPTSLQTAEGEVDQAEASEHIHTADAGEVQDVEKEADDASGNDEEKETGDSVSGHDNLEDTTGGEEAGEKEVAAGDNNGDDASGETTSDAVDPKGQTEYVPKADPGIEILPFDVVSLDIDEAYVSEPFSSLFPRDQALIATIAESMKERGFDPCFPLVAWLEADVIVDGYTRWDAAKLAGIKSVPVRYRSFKNEDEAIKYAIHVQRNRRNLTDSQILQLIKAVDQRSKRGGDRKSADAKTKTTSEGSDPSSKKTAKIVGTSQTKVEKGRVILDSGDKELKQAVQNGTMSINKAASIARQGKPKAKHAESQESFRDTAVGVQALMNQAAAMMEAHEKGFKKWPTRVRKMGEKILADHS